MVTINSLGLGQRAVCVSYSTALQAIEKHIS